MRSGYFWATGVFFTRSVAWSAQLSNCMLRKERLATCCVSRGRQHPKRTRQQIRTPRIKTNLGKPSEGAERVAVSMRFSALGADRCRGQCSRNSTSERQGRLGDTRCRHEALFLPSLCVKLLGRERNTTECVFLEKRPKWEPNAQCSSCLAQEVPEAQNESAVPKGWVA